MRDARGFTLIELVTVIAIIGIVLGIAAVSAQDWVARYKVEEQTRKLYADLMNGRTSALQNNVYYFVTLGSNQYAVYEDTDPAPAGDENLDTTKDTQVLQQSTQYQLVTTTTLTMISFASNGLISWPAPSTDTVYIRSDSTTNPTVDCMELASTRIQLGKWDNGTNTCIAQ